MAETRKRHPVLDEPYRPWRLLVLLSWLLFFLAHWKGIPGVALSFVQELVAAFGLMVLSWLAFPDRRGKLAGFAMLLAVAAVARAGHFSLGQTIALIGLVMMMVLGCLLWQLRHARARTIAVFVWLMLCIGLLEFVSEGLNSIVEHALS